MKRDRRMPKIKRPLIKPYEYDAYYNTKLTRAWTYLSSPVICGALLIILGCLSLIWTSIDISLGTLTRPFFQNPNNFGAGIPLIGSPDLAATWNENSIWPTIGKGIWVGLMMVGTGILSILSRGDGTFVSVLSVSIASWTTLVFSLYLILSSILSVQVYPFNGVFNRTYFQNIELAMNSLLIIMGALAFLVCLYLAIKSTKFLDYFNNGRIWPKYRRL
ncbi:hypothetical protein BpHYR1_021968 [Brachionus plicatilis]|uniref:Uncharacterized protein n=1 Tax=Brachionus plicatilis TaxID=10195 RepID=A0A3M7PFY8_BRAPC|nr:hypothetical protein BpHYR1_021968 [Brachionus plicatilis]